MLVILDAFLVLFSLLFPPLYCCYLLLPGCHSNCIPEYSLFVPHQLLYGLCLLPLLPRSWSSFVETFALISPLSVGWKHLAARHEARNRDTSCSKTPYSCFSTRILLFSEAVGSYTPFSAGHQGSYISVHPPRSKEMPSSSWCASALPAGVFGVWAVAIFPPQTLCPVCMNTPINITEHSQIPLHTSLPFLHLLNEMQALQGDSLHSSSILCFAALSCSAKKPFKPYQGLQSPPEIVEWLGLGRTLGSSSSDPTDMSRDKWQVLSYMWQGSKAAEAASSYRVLVENRINTSQISALGKRKNSEATTMQKKK